MAAASFMRRAAVLSAALAAVLAGGCTTVVAPAPICKPSSQQLLQPCDPLASLPDNVTYGDLLKTYQAERKSLVLCSLKASELAALITSCNAELEQFNARIQSERDKTKSGP